MDQQAVIDPDQVTTPSPRRPWRAKLWSWLVFFFVTITILTIFVPFNPDMPDTRISPEWLSAMRQARAKPEEAWRLGLARLDESWVMALNVAVARHLRFGKDIVFTFGPYASIFTRSFHPATDRLMIFGSLLIAIAYEIGLLYLARGHRIYGLLALLLFCVTFPPHDALLLSFPFLLIACAVKMNHSHEFESKRPWWKFLAVGLALAALGLLPLVKGSLLAPVGLSTIVLAMILFYRLPFRQALPLALTPILSTMAFWVIAGQSLTDIPSYLRGTLWLTSGYTEAMSTPWLAWPRLIGDGFIAAYLLISAVLVRSLMIARGLRTYEKLFWALISVAFLLVAFKHGFVRTDHIKLAFQSITLFILIVSFICRDRYLIAAGTIAVLVVLLISFRQDPLLMRDVRQTFGTGTGTGQSRSREVILFISKRAFGTLSRVTYETTFYSYGHMLAGLGKRMHAGALNARYEEALANIRTEYDVPQMAGTFDVYTYEQSILLASRDQWNPRPVFQSYSAYTPDLARLNEQHLRTGNAPDWVLLDLFTIDGRLPSIDDGCSWPALLDNYSLTSWDGQLAMLHKNAVVVPTSTMQVLYEQREPVGQTVKLPESESPLFAEVELKPTVLGKLLGTVLNPPELNLEVHLKNGDNHSYRVVSEMMQTEFLLSPLVRSTGDFVALIKHDHELQDGAKVESISISPAFGGSLFWQKDYLLSLAVSTQRRPGAAPLQGEN